MSRRSPSVPTARGSISGHIPTPLFDRDGKLAGAVNLLLDVSDEHQPDYLRAQAERCRRLAGSVNDAGVTDTLCLMAAKYDEQALRAARKH